MGGEMPQWLEDLKEYTRGMPQIDEFPPIESPEEALPSATKSIKDMSEDELGYNYQLVAKWQAFAEFAEGFYATAEAAAHQEYNQIYRQAYMRLKHEQPNGKFVNAKEGEIIVESDPDVLRAEQRWTALKRGHIFHKSNANAYGKYALTYAGERKDRREREARRLMQNNYYND